MGVGGLAARALVLERCHGGGYDEEFFADPVIGPVIFNGGWVVGFGQVVRHFVFGESPMEMRKTLVKRGF